MTSNRDESYVVRARYESDAQRRERAAEYAEAMNEILRADEVIGSNPLTPEITDSARLIFQGETLRRLMNEAEKELKRGGLAVSNLAFTQTRCDLAQLFLSYQPIWLQLALSLLLPKPPGPSNLKTAVEREIVAQPGKTFVRRSLRLILFLDMAKQARIIPTDPCLFRKTIAMGMKTTTAVLNRLSQLALGSTGELQRLLKRNAFTPATVQQHIHEVDFQVGELVWDLRDGIRLARLVEILAGGEAKLLSTLVYHGDTGTTQPAAVANLGKLYDFLGSKGLALSDIRPQDVVRAKAVATLELARRVLDFYQVQRRRLSATFTLSPMRYSRSFLATPATAPRPRSRPESPASPSSHLSPPRTDAGIQSRTFVLRRSISSPRLPMADIDADVTMTGMEEEEEDERKTASVIRIQSLCRGFLARRDLFKKKAAKEEEERKIASVIKIQALVRAFLARRDLFKKKSAKEEEERRTASIIKIQSLYRGFLVRRDLFKKKSDKEEEERRTASVIKIQALVRAFLARRDLFKKKSAKEEEERRTASIIKIQSLYRGFLVRRDLFKKKSAKEEEERKTASVIKIQSHARGYLLRKAIASERRPVSPPPQDENESPDSPTPQPKAPILGLRRRLPSPPLLPLTPTDAVAHRMRRSLKTVIAKDGDLGYVQQQVYAIRSMVSNHREAAEMATEPKFVHALYDILAESNQSYPYLLITVAITETLRRLATWTETLDAVAPTPQYVAALVRQLGKLAHVRQQDKFTQPSMADIIIVLHCLATAESARVWPQAEEEIRLRGRLERRALHSFADTAQRHLAWEQKKAKELYPRQANVRAELQRGECGAWAAEQQSYQRRLRRALEAIPRRDFAEAMPDLLAQVSPHQLLPTLTQLFPHIL